MTPTPYAVLDLHFSPHDPTLLCVAASTGLVELYRFDPATCQLRLESSAQLLDPLILVLSLAWHPTKANLIGITASSGEVYLCDLSKPEDEALAEIQKHSLEAWTLSFSPCGASVYSGGDDAALNFSENVLRADDDEGGLGIQWSDRRAHGAGVTAILPLAHEDNVTVTGSYDDNIRVIRTPLMGRREVLAEENLEGGVWRLKMLREEPARGR